MTTLTSLIVPDNPIRISELMFRMLYNDVIRQRIINYLREAVLILLRGIIVVMLVFTYIFSSIGNISKYFSHNQYLYTQFFITNYIELLWAVIFHIDVHEVFEREPEALNQ